MSKVMILLMVCPPIPYRKLTLAEALDAGAVENAYGSSLKAGAAQRIPVRLRESRRAALVALVGGGWENEWSRVSHMHILPAQGILSFEIRKLRLSLSKSFSLSLSFSFSSSFSFSVTFI